MAKTREIACKYYKFEGGCEKGRKGTFYKYCQKCDWYIPVKFGTPARKDLRRQKKEDAFRYDRRKGEYL